MLSLTGGSTLTVQQTNGMGLTFAGSSASDLTIDPSTMNLVFTSTAPNNWDFRWKDPATGGNWVGTIDSLIGSQITLSLLPGETYQVGDSNGYTYIYGVAGQSVPEPSSLVLAGIATAGVAIAMKRRRVHGPLKPLSRGLAADPTRKVRPPMRQPRYPRVSRSS